jgi:hypothetical protein
MSIQLGGNTTVRELAGRYPQTRTIFERYGIDDCGGGGECQAQWRVGGERTEARIRGTFSCGQFPPECDSTLGILPVFALISGRIGRNRILLAD